MQRKTPLIIGFDGTDLNNELAAHLQAVNPAGVILFRRNIISLSQTRQLIRQLRELLGEIIISLDHEGGIVSRFPAEVPIPPSPRALYLQHNEDLIHRAGRIQAEVLRYLGVTLNFAPVVDLYGNQDSRVIGIRAFSELPQETARYGELCIGVHEALGVGSTAKHFPGHGGTATDTHFATGSIEQSREQLLERDLYPFVKAIEAGVPAIMTAHLKYPAFDTENPASISKPIVEDLLRGKLGFQGLVITDCIEMAGLRKSYTPEQIIEQGRAAGVDLWISSFSFIKDRSFQQQLAKQLRKLPINELTAARLQFFLERYSREPTEELPAPGEGLALARSCITIKKENPLPETLRSFQLVELTGDDFKGLNAPRENGETASILFQKCAQIQGMAIFNPAQREDLQCFLEKNVEDHQGILLLTRNSFRRSDYVNVLQELTRRYFCVQIALLDEADLQGEAAVEWAVSGSNATMAEALVEPLTSLFKKEGQTLR